jgi:hypothetical protein
MDVLTLFGLVAVTAMLIFYALEDHSPWFILAFAGACLLASIRFPARRLAFRNYRNHLGGCRGTSLARQDPDSGLVQVRFADQVHSHRPYRCEYGTQIQMSNATNAAMMPSQITRVSAILYSSLILEEANRQARTLIAVLLTREEQNHACWSFRVWLRNDISLNFRNRCHCPEHRHWRI